MQDDLTLGKREALDEEFDYFNLEDERDRRAIDEQDDENFLQELTLLEEQVKEAYEKVERSRYENDYQIS